MDNARERRFGNGREPRVLWKKHADFIAISKPLPRAERWRAALVSKPNNKPNSHDAHSATALAERHWSAAPEAGHWAPECQPAGWHRPAPGTPVKLITRH